MKWKFSFLWVSWPLLFPFSATAQFSLWLVEQGVEWKHPVSNIEHEKWQEILVKTSAKLDESLELTR